ncbi:hypothetical protein OOK36_38595 [Streptomyces sp. NBC_00365]|uniref:hypothetical protein n=1 Tax=Streptomyces sp. NBC_00365 TaxID=2975726 RepID=UPI002255B31A|nr:hypothetical protein [Streptomyces sp. NBC_00365]MCX5094668.1 hypothetical protein [Streptomyces sp. NBC_00365]
MAGVLGLGAGLPPSRPVRLPLAGIDPAGVYRHGEQRCSGSHLTAVGRPVRWTAEHDAVARHRATASQSLGESAALR